ncbi:hypothetical protein BDQ12DRAFT_321986 [Crucibulum laeve]|uniref:F-box domain-containing protein n=1 Tax=Crucibulum laeve TaxID=68775 RepID=A0A5C3LPZ2_9AGAR|nr:hypothetical protein BDQ12DRAFT_321986 [Crucibulum laeve]
MAFSTEMAVSILYTDRSNHGTRSLSKTDEGNMRRIMSNDASSSTQSSPTVFKHFPNEILRHIFFLSLPEKPTTSPSEAPLLLANVCGLWRNIVGAFPLLFDGLPFDQIPRSGNLCVEESLTGFGTVTLQENWVYGHVRPSSILSSTNACSRVSDLTSLLLKRSTFVLLGRLI